MIQLPRWERVNRYKTHPQKAGGWMGSGKIPTPSKFDSRASLKKTGLRFKTKSAYERGSQGRGRGLDRTEKSAQNNPPILSAKIVHFRPPKTERRDRTSRPLLASAGGRAERATSSNRLGLNFLRKQQWCRCCSLLSRLDAREKPGARSCC